MARKREVSFDVTARERRLIAKIVDRARDKCLVRSKETPKHWYTQITCRMDLTAVHANGCRLDLRRLLDADDFNFTHDIAGIARHIDRNTGRLANHFLPRFRLRLAEAA
jgi:hypothetical protein